MIISMSLSGSDMRRRVCQNGERCRAAWNPNGIQSFSPDYKGCEERATLGVGQIQTESSTLKGLNPIWTWPFLSPCLNHSQRFSCRQEEHHRNVSFQDEFRQLLQRYEIEFDERYMWDWRGIRCNVPTSRNTVNTYQGEARSAQGGDGMNPQMSQMDADGEKRDEQTSCATEEARKLLRELPMMLPPHPG